MNRISPIKVFYSYSHKDEQYREELEKSLKIFERQGLIDDWNDRQITAGDEWRTEINENLLHSQIIILLVSPDFINSDYCYDIETATAIELDKKSKASVVPVIIRPCLFKETNFSYLQALPKDALPVSKWPDKDEAWLNVSEELKKLILKINTPVKKMTDNTAINKTKNGIKPPHVKNYAADELEELSSGNDEVEAFDNAEVSLSDLIKKLFSEKPDLYLTAIAIKKWAVKQAGYSGFSKYKLPEIEEALNQLTVIKYLKSEASKTGNYMFKLADK